MLSSESVRIAVHTAEVVWLVSVEVVGLIIPTPDVFTWRESRVRSLGKIMVGAVPPRNAGRQLVRMAVSIGTKCLATSDTMHWRYCYLCWYA